MIFSDKYIKLSDKYIMDFRIRNLLYIMDFKIKNLLYDMDFKIRNLLYDMDRCDTLYMEKLINCGLTYYDNKQIYYSSIHIKIPIILLAFKFKLLNKQFCSCHILVLSQFDSDIIKKLPFNIPHFIHPDISDKLTNFNIQQFMDSLKIYLNEKNMISINCSRDLSDESKLGILEYLKDYWY